MLYSSQLKSKEMKSFSEFWKSILFFLTFAAMSLVQVKRKCQARLLKQKYEALQEVAKGAPGQLSQVNTMYQITLCPHG